MNKLASLTLPGGQTITNPIKVGPNQAIQDLTLGGLVSAVLGVVFMISGFLMLIWAAVGIFQYITAGGNKEGLAKARARITWAVVGFLFIVVAFAASRYIQELIPTKQVPIQSVTSPFGDCPQPQVWDPALGRCSIR